MLTNNLAPALRVARWIDGAGNPIPPLILDHLGNSFKVIFCFQHWCPGCHSNGFPALQRFVTVLEPLGVGFAVVQTVFEGFEQNTYERLRENQQRYALHLPFGHDAIAGRHPTIMADYKTRGTPWFIFIDPAGRIIFSDFHIDVDQAIDSIESATRGRK